MQSATQADTRIRKRVPCSIAFEGKRQKAIVLNLSRGGLFVRTTARAKRGAEVSVVLNLEEFPQPVDVKARVVWARRSNSRVQEISDGGLGLRFRSAPQDYLDYMDELLPVSKTLVPPKPALHPYRLRLAQLGTTRTRWVDVEAPSEEAATDKALLTGAPGERWQVLEIALKSPKGSAKKH